MKISLIIVSLKRRLPIFVRKKYGILIHLNQKHLTKIWRTYYYDLDRYLTFSNKYGMPRHEQNLKSMIIAHYHALEKGLSLKEPRPGFGEKIVEDLLSFLQHYKDLGYNENDNQIQAGYIVLRDYLQCNLINNTDIGTIGERINKILPGNIDPSSRSFRAILRDELFNEAPLNFKKFAYNRHSIRNFTSKDVDLETLKEAIYIAQSSPSVCNRQSSFVYIIKDRSVLKQILNCQNGNRGFGEDLNSILIVCSNLRCFYDSGERNQAFIDGGIFAMTLTLALHSLELGTCILNWSVDNGRDQELRKIVPIKEEESIILLIAVGHIPAKLFITRSLRKNLEEIYKVV